LPVRWQFFGFEGIIDPEAERTRARLGTLEQEAHAPHVISKLAPLDLVSSGLLNATIFFVVGRWVRLRLRARATRAAFAREWLRRRGFGAAHAGRLNLSKRSAPPGVVRYIRPVGDVQMIVPSGSCWSFHPVGPL
jgi:hypothetical protein